MDSQKPVASAQIHRWDEILSEEMSPFLTRQYVSGEQAMLARITLRKGCVVPLHQHSNEQIAYIVSGALEFHVDGKLYVVSAGELLVIPANAPHSAVALEDTVDLDIFAPPRADWLAKDDSYLRQAPPGI